MRAGTRGPRRPRGQEQTSREPGDASTKAGHSGPSPEGEGTCFFEFEVCGPGLVGRGDREGKSKQAASQATRARKQVTAVPRRRVKVLVSSSSRYAGRDSWAEATERARANKPRARRREHESRSQRSLAGG